MLSCVTEIVIIVSHVGMLSTAQMDVMVTLCVYISEETGSTLDWTRVHPDSSSSSFY